MVEAVIGFRDAGNLKPPVAGAQSIEVPVLAPIIMRLGCPSDLYGTDGPIQRLLGKQHLPVLKSLADGMNATCRIDRRPGIGDHLIEAYKGKPLEEFFQNLHAEIDVDQRALQALIEKPGEKESAVRKTANRANARFSQSSFQTVSARV